MPRRAALLLLLASLCLAERAAAQTVIVVFRDPAIEKNYQKYLITIGNVKGLVG
jgi:hypothetical protein